MLQMTRCTIRLADPEPGEADAPSPIVVRIAGLPGFSMRLGACTWRLTSRGSQRVLTGSRHETTAQRLDRPAGAGSSSPAGQLKHREKAASCLPRHRQPRRL